MLITETQRQKKHLTKLLLDNGEEAFLDNDICINYSLKPETQISEEELNKLKYESEYVRAKSRALWYLDRADRTEKTMYEKLVTAGFDRKTAAAVVGRFVEVGLIDDRRFAENFAEKCRNANISKREGIRKLLAKGVPYDIANEVFSETEVDEEEQVRAVIEKKYARKLEQENGVQRVYAALVRKGFSFSAVRNALKKYSEELEYSEEEYV
ncbi:MAG: regulatory protein RecX [Acutalibacteraceae bacterium]|nr:regulatory protein RecX [Acutalibacteraceae bacterium]